MATLVLLLMFVYFGFKCAVAYRQYKNYKTSFWDRLVKFNLNMETKSGASMIVEKVDEENIHLIIKTNDGQIIKYPNE